MTIHYCAGWHWLLIDRQIDLLWVEMETLKGKWPANPHAVDTTHNERLMSLGQMIRIELLDRINYLHENASNVCQSTQLNQCYALQNARYHMHSFNISSTKQE